MSNPVAVWRTRTGHQLMGAGEVLSVDVSAFSVDGISNVTFTATDSIGYNETYVVTDRQRRTANYYRTTADSPLTGEVLPRAFDTYGFNLRAEDFASGKITIACTATSAVGDTTVLDGIVAHNQSTPPCDYTVYVSITGDNSLSGTTSGNAVQSIAVAVEKLRALNTATTGDIGGGVIVLEAGAHHWCRADDATSPAADTWTSDHWWLTIDISSGATIQRASDTITLASPEQNNKTQNDSDNILEINGGPSANQDINILFLAQEIPDAPNHTFRAGLPVVIDTDTSGDVRMAFEGGSFGRAFSVEGNTGTQDIAYNEGSSGMNIQICYMVLSDCGEGSAGADHIQECKIENYVSKGLAVDTSGFGCMNVVVDTGNPLDVDIYGWVDTDDVFGNVTVSASTYAGGMDITFGTGAVANTSGSSFNVMDGLSGVNPGAAMAISASSLVGSGRWGLVLSGFGANNSTPASSAFEVVQAALTADTSGNTVGFITVANASFNAADAVTAGATIRVAELAGTGAGTTYASLYPKRVGIDIDGSLSNLCVENVRLICDGGDAINMSSGSTVSRSALVNIGDAGTGESTWASSLTDVTLRHCTFASETSATGALSGCEILRCVFKEHSLTNNWSVVDQCFFSSSTHPAPTGSTNAVSGTWFNQTPSAPTWLMKPLEANLGALTGGSAYSSPSARWVNASGAQPLTAGVHADFGDALYVDQQTTVSFSGLLMTSADSELIPGSELFSLNDIPAQLMAAKSHAMVIGTGLGFIASDGQEGPGLISHDPRGLTGVGSIVLR